MKEYRNKTKAPRIEPWLNREKYEQKYAIKMDGKSDIKNSFLSADKIAFFMRRIFVTTKQEYVVLVDKMLKLDMQ